MSEYLLTKDQVLLYLKELAKLLKKNHASNCQLIIVGGSSILLNYSYRETTVDIDCFDSQGVLMNEIVNQVTNKYSLPNGWINTDFIKTDSFTMKLVQYSSYYATFSNVLEIRTIKDEYLIAMKMKSARNYKHDISDICGIVREMMINNNKPLSMKIIKKAIVDLYGDESLISQEVYNRVQHIIDNPSEYDELVEEEKNSKAKLIKQFK